MNEAQTVEAVFTQARDAEASAEEYLADVGWKSVEGRRQRPRANRQGPVRCFRVRFRGGAVLNCWGGGAAETASSGEADFGLATKVNLFYNGC